MSRKDRRAQQAKNRKQNRMSKADIEKRMRAASKGQDDTQVDSRHVFAQQLQAALHKAIDDCLPENEAPDVSTIIQCLGITAATFATANGVDEMQFVVAMRTYVRQVRESLGMPTASFDDPPGGKPGGGIIIPGS
jgi:hypothetical protein